MFKTNVVEKIKAHILCSITFFLNHAVYKIMWKYVVQPVPMRGRGSRKKLPRPGGPEGGLGLDYIAYVFVFLGIIIIYRLYKLTLSDQAQVTLQLTASLPHSV
jgi:hypothetical protein